MVRILFGFGSVIIANTNASFEQRKKANQTLANGPERPWLILNVGKEDIRLGSNFTGDT